MFLTQNRAMSNRWPQICRYYKMGFTPATVSYLQGICYRGLALRRTALGTAAAIKIIYVYVYECYRLQNWRSVVTKVSLVDNMPEIKLKH